MVYALNVWSPGSGSDRELFDTLLFATLEQAQAYVAVFDKWTQEDWFDMSSIDPVERVLVKKPKATLAADYTPPNPAEFIEYLKDVGYGKYAE